MLPAIITTLLWSYCVIAAKRSVSQLGENLANITRLAVAVILLGIIAHSFGLGLGGGGLLFFLLSGIIGFGFGDIGVFYALPRLGSRLTVLMAQCFAVPIAGLTEWLWLGTVLRPREIGAILIILVGICIALAPKKMPQTELRVFLIGIAFGTLAAAGQGIGAVLSRKAYMDAFAEGSWLNESITGSIIMGATAGYQRLIGGIIVVAIFFAFSLLYKPWKSYPSAEHRNDPTSSKATFVLLNALAGPTIGIICFQWALATTPSGIVQPIVAMTPIVIIPMSYIFEGEKPSLRSMIGAVISVVGVVALAMA